MAEHVPCIICGKDDSVSFMEVKDRIGPLKESYRLVKCSGCGLVYVNPQPSEKELEDHYPDIYWYQRRHLPSSLLHRVLNKAEEIIIESKLRPIIRQVRRRVKAGGKILDVGCGHGQILSHFRKHGFQTYGVEPSSTAAQQARDTYNLEVFNGNLIDARYPPDCFDGVTLYGVLEHLRDPAPILREVHRVLKDTGILILAIPNLGSLQFKVFRERWAGLRVPVHLYNYSSDTITKLLDKYDFTIKHISYFSFRYNPFSLICSLLPGFDPQLMKVMESEGKNPLGKKVLYFFLQMFVLPVTTIESLLRRGATMNVYARKSAGSG